MNYPIDSDEAGNEYPLNCDMRKELHRQRFVIPNHRYLRQLLLDDVEKVHVSEQKMLEQEMIDRQRILDANKHAEQLLHIAAKRPQDSDRELIAQFPPTVLQLSKLYQKNLTPFIQARMLTSAPTKKDKLPSRV